MDDIITIDTPDLEKVKRQLVGLEEKAPSAISKALNKTITQVQKRMAEEAQATYIVKKSAAKKTIRLKKAKVSNLSGEALSSSRDKVRLVGYKVSPTKPKPASPPKLYKSQVLKDGALKGLRGSSDRSAAFVAKMQSGHVGVFQRQYGTRMREPVTVGSLLKRRKPREQIAELYGLAVPMMFAGHKLSDTLMTEGKAFLDEELARQITKIQEVYG